MTYTIIIILIAFLIVCGIAGTAVQQHNEKKNAEKRDEISKHRTIFEETEEAAAAATQMPLSQLLIAILKKRSLQSLKALNEQMPSNDIYAKIEDLKTTINTIKIDAPAPDQNKFVLPKTDKAIIKYIQCVKKLRSIVRSEFKNNNISQKVFAQEDKALERLQLRINAETLHKRAQDATGMNMQGSARQYLEKAITALTKHKPQDDYTTAKREELNNMLKSFESAVKDMNYKQVLEQKQKEANEDLDNLFGPKKKW